MVDVINVKIGDKYVLKEYAPEHVPVKAKDKDGNTYNVSREVTRYIDVDIYVKDRIVETRDMGGHQVWYEVEYNWPAYDGKTADVKTYRIPLVSPLWKKFNIE